MKLNLPPDQIMQYVALAGLVIAVVAAAGVFAFRQVQTLRWVRSQPDLSPDDVRYFTRRSYSRLVGCVLLLVLAGLLAGLHFFGILDGLDALVAAGPQAKAEGRQLTPEQRDFVNFAYTYVGFIALVVFVLLIGSFLDTLATRRYGMRQRKQIRDDRQAMLKEQLARLRQERENRGPSRPESANGNGPA
ncbi:MAG: hypothetical protein NZM31_14825 [Gemmatales bacterium]|nr:hypothetical protein [Gemmatales bacterium]MDW8388269.1 hypothetical protein [Gemmatales bacterium]